MTRRYSTAWITSSANFLRKVKLISITTCVAWNHSHSLSFAGRASADDMLLVYEAYQSAGFKLDDVYMPKKLIKSLAKGAATKKAKAKGRL